MVVLFSLSLLFAWMSLQINATKWEVDEYHTLYLSSQNMFTGVYDSRNFGATRFLLKLITPFSLLYMTNRMGGEHEVAGWDYPGWFYILENLNSDASTFKTDPNIQDFVFMQRFIFVTIVLGFLFFVFYALWKRFSFYSALIFAVSIILFKPFLSEINYVYSNLFQLAVFALLIGLIINKSSLGKRDYLLYGFVLGLIASVKLEGIFLSIISMFFLFYTNENLRNRKLPTICTLVSVFLVLNVSEIRFPNAFLHYTFANLYHYKTGHFITEPSGLHQLLRMVETLRNPLTIFIAILVLSVFLWRKFKVSRENFVFLLYLSFLALGLVFTLQDQRFFVARNLLTLAFIFSILSSVLFGVIFKEKISRKGEGIASVLIIIVAIGLFLQVHSNTDFVTKQDLGVCQKIGIIGKTFIDLDASRIDSIPDTYTFTYDESKFIDQLNGYDCIIASWSENDKTFTNYILPKIFVLEKRLGDDFFFKRN